MTIRPPVEADERTQSLLPVAYSRPFAHIKHVGSFAQIRYGIQANKAGYDDAVLVTSDGRICESTVANIGFFDRDTVVWPEHPFCTASPGNCWIRFWASAGSRSAGDL